MKQGRLTLPTIAVLWLIGLQINAPIAVAQTVAEAVKRSQAEDQARQSAMPQFKWSGQTAPFKSRCFSDVCLGDDLAKLSNLKIPWLGSELISAKKLEQGVALGNENRGKEHTRSAKGVRFVQIVDASYRGLSEADQVTLASALTPPFTGFASDLNYRMLVPSSGFDYIVASAEVLNTMNRATVCAVLPALGVFRSESGYETSVLLVPENGKMAVARIARRWTLNVPGNASNVQQSQAISQQIAELRKQISETYGGHWINQAAVSDDTVAYYDESDIRHPRLTLYTRSFAAYQLLYDGTFQTKAEQRDQNRGSVEAKIHWGKVSEFMDAHLATMPGCEIKPTSGAVSIN